MQEIHKKTGQRRGKDKRAKEAKRWGRHERGIGRDKRQCRGRKHKGNPPFQSFRGSGIGAAAISRSAPPEFHVSAVRSQQAASCGFGPASNAPKRRFWTTRPAIQTTSPRGPFRACYRPTLIPRCRERERRQKDREGRRKREGPGKKREARRKECGRGKKDEGRNSGRRRKERRIRRAEARKRQQTGREAKEDGRKEEIARNHESNNERDRKERGATTLGQATRQGYEHQPPRSPSYLLRVRGARPKGHLHPAPWPFHVSAVRSPRAEPPCFRSARGVP